MGPDRIFGRIRFGLAVVFAAGIFCGACAATEGDVQKLPAQKVRPADGEDAKQKAEELYRKGDYPEASKALLGFLGGHPEDSQAHFLQGLIYGRLGETEKGRNAFLQVIALNPGHAKAYYNLGAIYANDGPLQNREKAAILFRKHLELEPNSANGEQIRNWLKGLESEQGQPADPDLKASDDDEYHEWLRKQLKKPGE